MKKRNIVGVIALLMVLGVLTTAYASSQNSSQTAGITPADLVSTDVRGGTYNKKGFPDNYITYSIEDSSYVIYNWNDSYLMGEASETNAGTSFWNIQIGYPTFREPELIGVSDRYLFFSVKNDSNTDKRIDIAVEIAETTGGYLNQYFHRAFLLEDLTDEEKSFHSVKLIEN